MRVAIRAVRVVALDFAMPRIVIFVKRPLSKPYFLLRLRNNQVFDNDIRRWVCAISHYYSWRDDRIPDLDVSKCDVLHLNASWNRAMRFNRPCKSALHVKLGIWLVLLLRANPDGPPKWLVEFDIFVQYVSDLSCLIMALILAPVGLDVNS